MNDNIFVNLNYIWIAIGGIVFFALLFITAPYGRHTKTSWGPLINNRLGWFIMEFFVLLVLFYFVLTGSLSVSVTNGVLIGFFCFHYMNRSLIFPFRLKTAGKKIPLSIVLMGMTFNLANGFLIGYFLGNIKQYSLDWLYSPQFIIGTVIFIVGLAINWSSDTTLIRLRKEGDKSYYIPKGRMFTYVSCPNLFGEIVEWLGFAIALWELPGWTFFIWTFANLVPRALAHHRWYLKKFPDYPKERKAVIPFIW